MFNSLVRQLAWVFLLVLAHSVTAQSVGSRVPEAAASPGDSSTNPPDPTPNPDPAAASSTADELPTKPPPTNLREWFHAPLSREKDRDGPIDTDRPTFTPATTVVPLGRVQLESGFTFNRTQGGGVRSNIYDFSELAVRIGIFNRVELRTFWTGQTYAQSQTLPRGPSSFLNGPSDLDIGFKWQLIKGDPKKKWLPTTALITSIIVPTGGTSFYSSQTIEPDINLIDCWSLTEKLTLSGSTGLLGVRQQAAPRSGLRADSFEQYHQSLVAFYSLTKWATLYHEWYVFTFTNAADNRPLHSMNSGVIDRFTPNSQFDLRAGFGLTGRPDDFLTGAGFSIRF